MRKGEEEDFPFDLATLVMSCIFLDLYWSISPYNMKDEIGSQVANKAVFYRFLRQWRGSCHIHKYRPRIAHLMESGTRKKSASSNLLS